MLSFFPKYPLLERRTLRETVISQPCWNHLELGEYGLFTSVLPHRLSRERRARGMRGRLPRGPTIKHFQWKAWQIASVRSLFYKLFFLNCWWKGAVNELINRSHRKSLGLVTLGMFFFCRMPLCPLFIWSLQIISPCLGSILWLSFRTKKTSSQ